MKCQYCQSYLMRPVIGGVKPIAGLERDLVCRFGEVGADRRWYCFGCDCFCENVDRTANLWIGKNYNHGVLVLGESWYGEELPLSEYIPKWIVGLEQDALFSRLISAFVNKGSRTPTERARFWNSIAFCNFVPGSVGATNRTKASASDFSNSCSRLTEILKEIQPHNVLILGKTQGVYSGRVCEALGIRHSIIRHPTSYGLKNNIITQAYIEVGLVKPVSGPIMNQVSTALSLVGEHKDVRPERITKVAICVEPHGIIIEVEETFEYWEGRRAEHPGRISSRWSYCPDSGSLRKLGGVVGI